MMLWFGKKKGKGGGKDGGPNGGQEGQKPSREELLAQARANAAAARAEIGDETLEKIRQAMMKKEQSQLEQARRKVMDLDRARIADNIRYVRDHGDDEGRKK